jgi:hypothetical protein
LDSRKFDWSSILIVGHPLGVHISRPYNYERLPRVLAQVTFFSKLLKMLQLVISAVGKHFKHCGKCLPCCFNQPTPSENSTMPAPRTQRGMNAEVNIFLLAA